MLIIVVVVFLALYFRQQTQATSTAQVEKTTTPTASPTTGQQGVTGNGDFASLLSTINKALDTTNHIIQTQTQKN